LLEKHGFARNKIWAIDENPPPLHPIDSNGKAFVDECMFAQDVSKNGVLAVECMCAQIMMNAFWLPR
jgi:hypothetical protein